MSDDSVVSGRYGKGYRPSARDGGERTLSALLGADRRRGTGAPPSPSLQRFVPFVRDQKQTQSCVGHALARGLYVYAAAHGAPQPPEPSPGCAYVVGLAAQRGDPEGEPLADAGVSPAFVVAGLNEFGVAPEAAWPFDAAHIVDAPGMAELEGVSCYQGFESWFLAPEGAADRMLDVERALLDGCPVAVGAQVDQAFEDYSGSGVVTAPAGPSLGGHMTLIVASYQRERVLVLNSWGEGWGLGGYYWADLAWLGAAQELVVVTAAVA